MALDFCMAQSQRAFEKGKINGRVALVDGLQDFLYDNESLIDINVKFIYDFDPYGDVLLGTESIKELMGICNDLKACKILDKYNQAKKAKEDIIKLAILCKRALETEQYIFVLGD